MIVGVLNLLLFASVADARVDFYGSQIFDEYDFKGQASVSVVGPCTESCAIYASVTPDSLKLANNLLIQTPFGYVSVGDLANRKNQTSNEKLPLILKSIRELKIVNGNANANAGPLVLYVVEGSHDGRVFEADGLDFAITEPMFMTVISARPFTLKQDDDEAALGPLRVTLTGFDGMYDLDCPDIYKKE